MIDLKKNTFLREIPDNLLVDEKVSNMAYSLQKSLDRMIDWVDKITYRTNISNLPDEIIEHLLWESHITWHEGLSLASTRQEKIRLIESSIELHRKKGTASAIELVMDILNFKGEVSEWFEYGGEPFYFRITTDEPITDQTNLDLLVNLINEFKNTRSWLENITIQRNHNMDVFVGGIVSEWKQTTLNPIEFRMPNLLGMQYAAGYISSWNQSKIQMEVNVNG